MVKTQLVIAMHKTSFKKTAESDLWFCWSFKQHECSDYFFSTAMCAQEKLTVDFSVVVGEARAAVVRDRTVRQVAVAVVGRGARDHRGAILHAHTERKKRILGSRGRPFGGPRNGDQECDGRR